MINFNHQANSHSLNGAKDALVSLNQILKFPKSVLDVGCGYAYWLKAFHELFDSDVFGIDGIDIPSEYLQINKSKFLQVDLNRPFNLNKKFDWVVSLEVAEHLLPQSSDDFIQSLTLHADKILFSAAIPNQKGDHHINCQWQDFWQEKFNQFGYECDDSPRWTIWNQDSIEPWYCQNMFFAFKSENAGKEARIKQIVHPRMVEHIRTLDTIYLEGKIIENQNIQQELNSLKLKNTSILGSILNKLR